MLLVFGKGRNGEKQSLGRKPPPGCQQFAVIRKETVLPGLGSPVYFNSLPLLRVTFRSPANLSITTFSSNIRVTKRSELPIGKTRLSTVAGALGRPSTSIKTGESVSTVTTTAFELPDSPPASVEVAVIVCSPSDNARLVFHGEFTVKPVPSNATLSLKN